VQQAPPGETPQAPQPVPPPSPEDAAGTAPSAGAKSIQEASDVEIATGPADAVVPRARDERPAPAAPLAKEKVASRVEKDDVPAPTAGQAKARADGFAPAPSPLPPATPAPAGARAASPGRAMEVRRNEAGEEVPVRGSTRRVAPAPSPATASDADRAGLVRKQRFAEPLEAMKRSAPAETLGAAVGALKAREDRARVHSFAQPPAEGETRVCGEVRDAAARPVVGAQVVLTDLGRSTTTDAAGRFCISAPSGEHSLSVMAVGYAESRQRVRAEDAGAGVRVTLAAVPVLEGKGVLRTGRAATTWTSDVAQVEPRDGYSVLSDTVRRVVREAQRIEADAAARRSASHYDLAARSWERALRRLAGGPLEIETRRHLADARYRAWEIGPNSRRALAAVEALTAYAGRAPAGPERDEAARRLQRVRP